MANVFKRMWRYWGAALTGRFEEYADPKIQIEQAIEESERQHRLLTEQAANVIAHQKDTEIQLNRAIDQVEKLSSSSRQALLMSDAATKRRDTADSRKYEHAAQAFTQRLIVAEQEVASLKEIYLQASEAAGGAKRAVQTNRMQLERRYTEKTKLLSQLDQAKMQERMSSAMSSMSATVNDEIPNMDQVRRKIEQRYARALGAAELQADGVDAKMLEIEQATMDFEADARLDEMRSQLGLASSTERASQSTEPELEAAKDKQIGEASAEGSL